MNKDYDDLGNYIGPEILDSDEEEEHERPGQHEPEEHALDAVVVN